MASLSSVERFNPHLNKWVEVREMGQRRAGNGVSKLNGCLYVVGERQDAFISSGATLGRRYSLVSCVTRPIIPCKHPGHMFPPHTHLLLHAQVCE